MAKYQNIGQYKYQTQQIWGKYEYQSDKISNVKEPKLEEGLLGEAGNCGANGKEEGACAEG